ncbi:hypothetical protein Y032_0073g764 [Ancylostoma ceylanicum]|nr:hypothetical protein Y032_0073g764 [Ancylostoma ceylanicum]
MSDSDLTSIVPVYPPMEDSVWFHKEEILELLLNWSQSFSLTPDGIPLSFIKNIAHAIAGPLELICNLSFMRAEVPDRWRHALVTPIPKKKPHTSPSNYRPISITSIFARLFEKILKKRIVAHLSSHSIISDNQHGFQKGKSTVTAMIQVLNDWTSLVDEGKNVDVIYFDFCKAFDKVSHEKLLYKLCRVGVHPRIVSWIKAFLSNRTFTVRVNGSSSNPRYAYSGVPQGGVLSPVLFNVYTHELPQILHDSGVGFCFFADDLKIYRSVDSNEDTAFLQNTIGLVEEWSQNWDLPLSKEKTKVLRLGSHISSCNYTLAGTPVANVEKVRDLGFIVTSNLGFDSHCQDIASKAMKLVHNLFRALSTRNSMVYLKAYKSFIRPMLEYGTPVFCPHSRKSIERLEQVQNTFTRKLMVRIVGFSYDKIPNRNERNKNFGLKKLSFRRKVNDLLLLHKIVHVVYENCSWKALISPCSFHSLMLHASCSLVDMKTFCTVSITILCLAKSAEGKVKQINVRLVDANDTLILTLPIHTDEQVRVLYDILATRRFNFTCLTYNGFHLRNTNSFDDFGIRKNVANFRVETGKCTKALSPRKYFARIYKNMTTLIPPGEMEGAEETNFALVVLWIVGIIVGISVSLAVAYYVLTIRRAEQIEQDLEDIKKGKTVTSSTSTSDTLRTARSVVSKHEKTVSYVVIESEHAKIEGEEEVPDTSTSSIEVREVKRLPQDDKKKT